VEAFAAAVEGLALAEWLRYSRWSYAAVNAAHVLGIALLIGATVTLDLRLLGIWRSIEVGPLYRVLSSVAATGLAIAIVNGLLLFSVRATEYVLLDLFFVKLALIVIGAGLAAVVHFGLHIEQLTRNHQRLIGALSLLIWPSVLVCGRMLAFL
jgi:hypothetical protein